MQKRFPIYSQILKLYPKAYREQYGEQMLQTLADMLDASPSRAACIGVWMRLLFDLPLSISRQQVAAGGQALFQETPRFVRRNSVYGAVLFVPFFVFVALNGMTNRGLYHTWIWNEDALWVWIVTLPALGVCLGLATFGWWLRSTGTKDIRSVWRGLRDIRHNWPMVVVALIGIGILALVFFHDSTHCVLGNPVHELHNLHDTLECVQHG